MPQHIILHIGAHNIVHKAIRRLFQLVLGKQYALDIIKFSAPKYLYCKYTNATRALCS